MASSNSYQQQQQNIELTLIIASERKRESKKGLVSGSFCTLMHFQMQFCMCSVALLNIHFTPFLLKLDYIFRQIMKPRIIFLLSQYVAIITCLQQSTSTNITNDITNEESENVAKSANFDIFVFTQHWPYTTCYDWMSSGHGHKCTKSIGK